MWTEETFQLVRDGIDAAKTCRKLKLTDEWEEKLDKRAQTVELANTEESVVDIIIFHVKVPAHASKISTPDIKGGEQGNIDYEGLLDLNIKTALWAEPRARIIILTDHEFAKSITKSERVSVVRFDVNGAEPMFERVFTMASYVRSAAFINPIIFLDIDAFLLRPLSVIFNSKFDVGLTHRHIVGQMAINEGVIFANNINKKLVIKFFDSYLASYLAAEKSEKIGRIYKNIRRWRGGQLAINAAAGGFQFYSTSCQVTEYGARLAFLPCSKYNLSQISEGEVNKELRNRCSILHLKGNRKGWISRLKSSLNSAGFFDG